MKRIALLIDGVTPVNALVIADGAKGDKWLKANSNAIEVTGLDPMPGVGSGWTYVKGKWVAPVIASPTIEQVEAARRLAYQMDADPIFFEYQRGDKTKQEWLDAVQAVKEAHPYPDAG